MKAQALVRLLNVEYVKMIRLKNFFFVFLFILGAMPSVKAETGSGSPTPAAPTAAPAATATPASSTNAPPADQRAKLVPSVEATPNGAKVKASFHMYKLSSPVSWSILAPVMDPTTGRKNMIELVKVDDQFVHSDTDYHTERTYELDYAKINAELKQKAPNAKLEIGPGTSLYAYARWMNQPELDMYTDQLLPGAVRSNYNNGWNHQWGGLAREGIFTLPGGTPAPAAVTSGFTKGGTTTALDVNNAVDQATKTKYFASDFYNSPTAGSRFENELKLHVDLNDLPKVAKYFTDLESDPALVESTFGPGWKLVANRKYVGQPMVDDYMDNDKSDAASLGMALRYRTGNGVTSLNFKPNDGKYAEGAVYERIEYDMRDFPEPKAMESFVNSDHPINPLQIIRWQTPGSTPSDFFVKRVKLTDERLKFELTAPSGDQVEISLDDVRARQLDKDGMEYGPTARYGQLEVEVNHLGAKGSSTNSTVLSENTTIHGAELDNFLKNLGPNAVITKDIPPVFHGEEDFKANSPIKTTNASNFKLAFGVFEKIREGAFGKNWHSSGQKYAVAAAGLGLVPPERFAPSVNRMLEEKEGRTNLTSAEKMQCLSSLVKISN